jgi:hypothetical protein
MMDDDPDIDHQAQDADDYYQDIVVEDAASMPDGCLGSVIVIGCCLFFGFPLMKMFLLAFFSVEN